MDKDFLEQLALKIKSHSNCSDMEDIKITFFMFELYFIDRKIKIL